MTDGSLYNTLVQPAAATGTSILRFQAPPNGHPQQESNPRYRLPILLWDSSIAPNSFLRPSRGMSGSYRVSRVG